MTPAQLIKEIGSDRYRPAYYFFGQEDYRKTEAIKYVLNNFLPRQQRTLNFTRLSTNKDDLETIIGETASIPMLGERRLVLVDEIQRLKPAQYKKLFAYLKDLPPNIVVILSSPAVHTPDKKSAFMREVGKVAETVKFDRLTASTAKSRIEKNLESAGFTYDKEAVELLISMTGGDFGGLTGELEKLSLSSDAGTHIGVDEVKRMVSSHEEFNIFELLDTVAYGKTDHALRVCRDLMLRGMKPVPILRLLSGHLMKLAKIHAGKKVQGHPFFVEKLNRQARLYGKEKVASAIYKLAEAERGIRRSKLRESILLENLIREICA